tara:strand:- start:1089 stop:1904 length:816 start_codon:yes stop_codon:yes gene_type:complete
MTFEKNKINKATARKTRQVEATFSNKNGKEVSFDIFNILKTLCLDGKLKLKNSKISDSYAEICYDGSKVIFHNGDGVWKDFKNYLHPEPWIINYRNISDVSCEISVTYKGLDSDELNLNNTPENDFGILRFRLITSDKIGPSSLWNIKLPSGEITDIGSISIQNDNKYYNIDNSNLYHLQFNLNHIEYNKDAPEKIIITGPKISNLSAPLIGKYSNSSLWASVSKKDGDFANQYGWGGKSSISTIKDLSGSTSDFINIDDMNIPKGSFNTN